ncbi:MAG: hypothetical protein NWE88_01115 [Candidatus Bathyarchaeota archaeon]|nr:hypothetical protein [Candidatus Bathyarchaeota archaeon]
MEKEDMEKGILPVEFDLTKSGLESCFKPYKVLMLKYSWLSLTEEEPKGSGHLWLKVNELLPDGETKSRASVIFAANDYVDMGIWDFKDATGKGGHHRLYYPVISEDEFWERLAESVKQKINESSGKNLL